MKLFTCLTLFLTLPFNISAMYGTGNGIILLTSDQQTRSGVLSSTHTCAEFPSQFKAAHVKNTGSTHCALWTEADCKGTLYVVPAHYQMRIPQDQFQSVIC